MPGPFVVPAHQDYKAYSLVLERLRWGMQFYLPVVTLPLTCNTKMQGRSGQH